MQAERYAPFGHWKTASLVMVSLFFLLMSCSNQEEITLGFSGCLTGKHSDLGTSGRDGALLAVEEINARGGIKGTPLRLLVKDDENDPQKAVEVDQQLIEEGVSVILGHMTSGMTMAAYETVMKSGALLVSPSASTDLLSGRDDNFLRLTTPASFSANYMASLLRERFGLTTTAVVFDLSNKAYSQSILRSFSKAYAEAGGRITDRLAFTSGEVESWHDLAAALLANEPQAIYLVANGIDAALLVQRLRQHGYEGTIATSGWAKTNLFLENGGAAAEGVLVTQTIDLEGTEPSLLTFKARFKEKYGRQPNFAALYAYEAVSIVSSCMTRPEALPQEIKTCMLAGNSFHSPHGPVSFDEYGDPNRPILLFAVQDGRFERVD